MKFQNTKFLTIILMVLAWGLGATNATEQEGRLDSPTLVRMFSEDNRLLFALTCEIPEDEDDRQDFVKSAKRDWRALTEGFPDATLSPTLENIPALTHLHEVSQTCSGFSVSMEILNATISLQQNKGGKLSKKRAKPTREQIFAAVCLIESGVPDYTDEDLLATAELQNDYRGQLGIHYEKPELKMINAVKHLAVIYGYELALKHLSEFLRIYSLMGENGPYPDENFLSMGLQLGDPLNPDAPKPDLEEIHEGLELKKQGNTYPKLSQVQESIKVKSPEKYLKQEQEAAARKDLEAYHKAAPDIIARLAGQCKGLMYFEPKMVESGVQEHHVETAWRLQKYAGIKEADATQVMLAEVLNKQQEGSEVPGIPFEQMTQEHLKGFKYLVHNRESQAKEIQAKFWEK